MGNLNVIKTCSYSRLADWEKCKLLGGFKSLLRIPEPDRGPPPNGKEWPNDRGTRVHDECEAFVRGQRDEPPAEAAKHFREHMYAVREWHLAGKAVMEDLWCFDRNWCMVDAKDFKNIWVRIKLDLAVFVTDTHAVAVDYKTGKRFGNEIKHAEQMQLYAIALFLRYPQLETLTTELWYFDQDEQAKMTFTRRQAERFMKNFDRRLGEMTTFEYPDKQFLLEDVGMQQALASPSVVACKWCPYGPKNSQHCKVGEQ